MGSNPTKMIKKINAIFEIINAKFTNIDLNKRDIDLGKLMQKWIAKIENDLKIFFRSQQRAFDNLFIAIKEEMMSSIKELHPNYMKQYAVDDQTNITFYKRLQNLYKISSIENYLKANGKGNDLHIICYCDARQRGILENFNPVLSERINVEWNINDQNIAQVLADEIICYWDH